MPIKQTTPRSAVDKALKNGIDGIINNVTTTLAYVGLKSVTHARMLPSPPVSDRANPHQPNYIDDTAVLRSSTGFLIVSGGQVIDENFKSQVGREAAIKEAARHSGLALIVVSGAKYSAYVSAKGYDVLDSAERMAIQLAGIMLRGLQNR